MSQAILLVAHGSRLSSWAESFNYIHREILELSSKDNVFLCFLQMMSPSLPEALQNLYQKGFRDVLLWPLFLGVGMHVKNDIVEELQSFLEDHPDLNYKILPSLAEDKECLDLLVKRGLFFLQDH